MIRRIRNAQVVNHRRIIAQFRAQMYLVYRHQHFFRNNVA